MDRKQAPDGQVTRAEMAAEEALQILDQTRRCRFVLPFRAYFLKCRPPVGHQDRKLFRVELATDPEPVHRS